MFLYLKAIIRSRLSFEGEDLPTHLFSEHPLTGTVPVRLVLVRREDGSYDAASGSSGGLLSEVCMTRSHYT